MPDKNLSDIKIDELDSSKKSPITNILTLLALLFIILVISVVITKLILNTDSTIEDETNSSSVQHVKDLNGTSNEAQNSDDKKTTDDKKASDDKKSSDETKHQTTTAHVVSPHTPTKILDRNLSSAIKTPLTSHVPKKEHEAVKTYATPKKNTTPKKEVSPKHNASSAHNTSSTHNASTTHTTPKKEYIDKVVHAKQPKHTTSTKHTTHTTHASSTKNASFLGGHVKKLTNSYYIKVGTYRNPNTVISKVKKANFNYAVAKVENNPDLTRVLVGPFFSRNQATAQLAKVKAKVLTGAYVTKVK